VSDRVEAIAVEGSRSGAIAVAGELEAMMIGSDRGRRSSSG
jgi:hypothetical protein